MHSEGAGRREATPKTAKKRAQSPRRGARDGDGDIGGAEVASKQFRPICWPGVGELSPDMRLANLDASLGEQLDLIWPGGNIYPLLFWGALQRVGRRLPRAPTAAHGPPSKSHVKAPIIIIIPTPASRSSRAEGSERQRPTASARRDRKSGREGPAAASTPQPSGSAASPGAPARPEAARQAAPPPDEEAGTCPPGFFYLFTA